MKLSGFRGPIFLAVFLSGCVSLDYSPEVLKNTGPDLSNGYLLGRFTREGENSLEIGLRLTCDPKCSDQIIKFKKYSPYDVVAIKAPPGTYTVSTIHFVNRMGGLIHHKNIEKPTGKLPISAPFKVDPGKIYYLGDFVGETSVKIEGGYIHQAWRIKDYTYKPKQTAEIFVTEHPEFKNIVIEEPFRASVPK